MNASMAVVGMALGFMLVLLAVLEIMRIADEYRKLAMEYRLTSTQGLARLGFLAVRVCVYGFAGVAGVLVFVKGVIG